MTLHTTHGSRSDGTLPTDAGWYAEADARKAALRKEADARLAAFAAKHGPTPTGNRALDEYVAAQR